MDIIYDPIPGENCVHSQIVVNKEINMSLTEFLFSFNGRVNRAKYWLMVLILSVIPFIILLLSLIIGEVGSVLYILYSVITIWPGLAISAKRWHDRDKSAWWILIGFIPIIGTIWTLVELGFLKGTSGNNRYGPDPLESS